MASKRNLASLKTKVDNLDVDKLKSVPVDLRELTNLVDNDLVKKLCMVNLLSNSMLLYLRLEGEET